MPGKPSPTLRILLPVTLLAPLAWSCGGGEDAPDAGLASRSEVSIVRPGEPSPAPPPQAPAVAEPQAPAVAEPQAPSAAPSAPAGDPLQGDPAVRAARESVSRAEQALAAARAELARAEQLARHGPLPDPDVFREVQRLLLEDPALGHVAIAAEVEDGVVTLRGAVPDASTAAAAIDLAGSVEGVRQVRSELRLVE